MFKSAVEGDTIFCTDTVVALELELCDGRQVAVDGAMAVHCFATLFVSIS